MTNLNERLDKQLNKLNGVNESRAISPKELLDLLKKPSNRLKQVLKTSLYPVDNDFIGNFKEDPSIYGFQDSYVVEDYLYDFMAYCICKAYGVDSGIDINKAAKSIDLNADERPYLQALKDFNYSDYIARYGEEIEDPEIRNLIKKGVDPSKIALSGDDAGDELYNPYEFAADAEEFARLCGANDLANKIASKSKKAKHICELIYLN